MTTAATGATAEVAGVEVSTEHFIGGRRVGSRERFEVISPIDGQRIAEVAAGGPDEVDQAVTAAREAFPAWAAAGATGRAEILHRLADLIDANLERLAIVECTDMAMLLRSLRARVIKRGALSWPGVDATRIMGVFGGGGHQRAAGCTIFEAPAEAIQQVLPLVLEELQAVAVVA